MTDAGAQNSCSSGFLYNPTSLSCLLISVAGIKTLKSCILASSKGSMTFANAFRSALPSTMGNVLTAPSKAQQSFAMSPRSPRPSRKATLTTKALSQDELKQQAAFKAVEYVQSNTAIGLGTGSTAAFAVARIGQLLKEGKLENIVAVPTSIKTYEQAKSMLLPAHSHACINQYT